LTVHALPTLHAPDEPAGRAEAWLAAVLDGNDLTAVLCADDGFVPWLWLRWNSVTAAGLTRHEFEQIVVGYRREVWLWLAGERIWSQCCSGLVGRVTRRMTQAHPPVA
jgi:hypothetical protein